MGTHCPQGPRDGEAQAGAGPHETGRSETVRGRHETGRHENSAGPHEAGQHEVTRHQEFNPFHRVSCASV